MAGPMLEIDVQGMERIRRNLGEAAKLHAVGDVIKQAVTFAEGEAERGAKPHAGDLGKLSHGNNIRQELHGTPVALGARVYTNSPIVVAVDQGREPGGKFPPIRLLEVWAARHGIALHNGKGFHLARSISRKGTKGVGFFRKAAAATEKKIDGYLKTAARRIESDWRK